MRDNSVPELREAGNRGREVPGVLALPILSCDSASDIVPSLAETTPISSTEFTE